MKADGNRNRAPELSKTSNKEVWGEKGGGYIGGGGRGWEGKVGAVRKRIHPSLFSTIQAASRQGLGDKQKPGLLPGDQLRLDGVHARPASRCYRRASSPWVMPRASLEERWKATPLTPSGSATYPSFSYNATTVGSAGGRGSRGTRHVSNMKQRQADHHRFHHIAKLLEQRHHRGLCRCG